ncbi:MAG: hypothetical protein J0L84_02375 [Verrucomicrobia bacterium]|nr:hypothetical protein [Verrucomicrobiota bacterium]
MPPEPPPHPLTHRDRSTRLILFGVLTVVFGGLSLALVPLMFMSLLAGPAAGGAGSRVATLIPGVMLYGGLGALLVTLGIGSILARRWARALLLIGAWSTLAVGLVATVSLAFLLPTLARQFMPPGGRQPPPGAVEAGLWGMLMGMGLLLVVVPALWVLVYGSRNVKATCEARNPSPCWTDACPLPVLAVALWIAAGVPWMVLTPVLYRGVLLFFGMFISGPAGALGYLILTVLWIVAAWWIYRLDLRGWWMLAVTLVVYGLSNILTYQRHSMAEMYALMGLLTPQVEALKGTSFMNWMTWMTAASTVATLVYLIAIRRYFSPHRSSSPHDGVSG